MLYLTYSILLLLLTIYSYSQIDLNLTLSSNPIYQNFQQQLIYLGYFNRPLSTFIYLFLLFLLLTFYFLLLYLIKQHKISKTKLLWLIVLSCVILFFSYSAFSHDLFNYMFDVRIVTKYGQNPYIHSALDYPSDLWTRFMHWTHRTYPYGPVWLLLTLPASILGFGKFTLTLFNFKLLFTLFHLGNIFLIYKILKKINPKLSLLGASVYAFNPVVLIESLVSPHNEVMMLFFLLLAIYQLSVKNNRLLAVLSLLLSAGIKFVTVILLSIFLLVSPGRSPFGHLPGVAKRFLEGETWDKNRWLILNLILLIPPLFLQIIFREPYPWYFIPLVGVGALLVQSRAITYILYGLSLGSLFRYAPFLYSGEYNKSTRSVQDLLFLIPLIIIPIFYIFKSIKTRLISN